MKKRRIFLNVSIVIAAALVFKAVLFFIAKPKVTVDYVAEYNRISRPENYDPNENAAPYYQKAFDAFVETPKELGNPYINWPADLNSAEQAKIENWTASNSQAFEYFREALNKPYFWIKRTTDETDCYLTRNYMGEIKIPDDSQLRNLTDALVWDAKLKAVKGEFQTAFKNIIDCYRAGNHKCNPKLLWVEQYCGLYIRRDAIQDAFIILNKSKADNKSLKFLQDDLQREFDRDNYIPGCQAEKLYKLDELQRKFMDNGRGTGRLWWRLGFSLVIPLSGEGDHYERKVKMSCFVGPTRKQAAEQIEQTADLFNQVIAKTPWQTKNDSHDYIKEINDISDRYLSLKVLDIGSIYPFSISNTFYKIKSKTEALIAVLAILRFKIDNGRLPVSLKELADTGYIKSLPMDPYSNGPLVYKTNKDTFTLYSVGDDFIDDGGSNEPKTKKVSGFRVTYTTSYGYPLDIVYWPVRELKRPHRELAIEGTEKAGESQGKDKEVK